MINIEMIIKLLREIDSDNEIIRRAKGSYQYTRSTVTNIKKAVKNGRQGYN